MEVSGQFHDPAILPPHPQGKFPWHPFVRKLGGSQSRSRRGGGEKYSQPQPGLEPPIIQPVVQRYTTELTQLLNTQYSEDLLFASVTAVKCTEIFYHFPVSTPLLRLCT
jgi:hypothetical protein